MRADLACRKQKQTVNTHLRHSTDRESKQFKVWDIKEIVLDLITLVNVYANIYDINDNTLDV